MNIQWYCGELSICYQLHSTHRKPHALGSVFLLRTHIHVSECRMRIHILGVLVDDTACVIEKIEDTCHDPRVVAILDLSNGGVCRLEVLFLRHAKILHPLLLIIELVVI